MGHPDGDLSQSPGKSCLPKSNAKVNNSESISQVDATSKVAVTKVTRDCSICANAEDVVGRPMCSCSRSCTNVQSVSPENDEQSEEDVGDDGSIIVEEGDHDPRTHHRLYPTEFHQSSPAIHSHQRDHRRYPHIGTVGVGDTVKNISEESGLSSSGDVSSSLSSSESFSGSEDISAKSSEKALTRERALPAEIVEDDESRCQKGIDEIHKQQEQEAEKLDGTTNIVAEGNCEQLDCPGNDEGKEGYKDRHDDHGDDGNQHVLGNERVVGARSESIYCDISSANGEVEKGAEISTPRGGTETGRSVSGSRCEKGNSIIMMETMTEGRRIGSRGKEKVCPIEGSREYGESSCHAEMSQHPSVISGAEGSIGVTHGTNGNHAENIWTFSSLEMSSSQSSGGTQPAQAESDREKQRRHQYEQHRDSRPQTREKRRVFGLSGFGCKFNLNKIFSSSSSPRAGNLHQSTERLNNQLTIFPPENDGDTSLVTGTATILSNVSKSSSESNILMCHNSLDNLTDELPSSRSTDSSCLLPTSSTDDHILDHPLRPKTDNLLTPKTCCCCNCCCCKSNGNCDHGRRSEKCTGHSNTITGMSPASSRCSSSPATVGRHQKYDNTSSDGTNDSQEDTSEYSADASLSCMETNNNRHHTTSHGCSSTGNQSDSGREKRNKQNRPTCPGESCSQPSSPVKASRERIVRLGNGNSEGYSDRQIIGDDMRRSITACGSSSASHSNRNPNGDSCSDDGFCYSSSNCTGCGDETISQTVAARDPAAAQRTNGTVMITVSPTFVNSLGKNSPVCSSSSSTMSSTSSSASPSCSTTSRSSSNSSASCSASESKASGSSNSGGCGNSDSSCSSTSSSHPTNLSHGQKFKLLSDGDVQVCRVKHGKNLVDKVIGSKLLRRWETHHLYLNDACISSKTVSLS